ncbi:hypothetical protein HDU85_000892 [Gaertneriomyces sp. JEL0708]|nr:hypothetical protein HDU85_000892 [Gaertneriomyces sp. JEL0708]
MNHRQFFSRSSPTPVVVADGFGALQEELTAIPWARISATVVKPEAEPNVVCEAPFAQRTMRHPPAVTPTRPGQRRSFVSEVSPRSNSPSPRPSQPKLNAKFDVMKAQMDEMAHQLTTPTRRRQRTALHNRRYLSSTSFRDFADMQRNKIRTSLTDQFKRLRESNLQLRPPSKVKHEEEDIGIDLPPWTPMRRDLRETWNRHARTTVSVVKDERDLNQFQWHPNPLHLRHQSVTPSDIEPLSPVKRIQGSWGLDREGCTANNSHGNLKSDNGVILASRSLPEANIYVRQLRSLTPGSALPFLSTPDRGDSEAGDITFDKEDAHTHPVLANAGFSSNDAVANVAMTIDDKESYDRSSFDLEYNSAELRALDQLEHDAMQVVSQPTLDGEDCAESFVKNNILFCKDDHRRYRLSQRTSYQSPSRTGHHDFFIDHSANVYPSPSEARSKQHPTSRAEYGS